MKKGRKPRLGFSIFSMKRTRSFELKLNSEQIMFCIQEQIRRTMQENGTPLNSDTWIEISLSYGTEGGISAHATWEETHEADPGG